MLFALIFPACDLLDPENLGIYSCEDYCDQVISKTDECAQAECTANPDQCGDYSEEDLATYAANGRDDWDGKSRKEMVDSCNSDLADADKSEGECNTETALVNNLSCDDILGLIGDLGG